MSDDRRIVYVTGAGRIQYCAQCGAAKGDCACQRADTAALAPRDGFLRVGCAAKGRGGKTVTTIVGAPGSLDELHALAQTLKRLCGSGGTVRADGVIEIQGDVRERVERKLLELGYRVKRVGG